MNTSTKTREELIELNSKVLKNKYLRQDINSEKDAEDYYNKLVGIRSESRPLPKEAEEYLAEQKRIHDRIFNTVLIDRPEEYVPFKNKIAIEIVGIGSGIDKSKITDSLISIQDLNILDRKDKDEILQRSVEEMKKQSGIST